MQTTRCQDPEHQGLHMTMEVWVGKHTPKKSFFLNISFVAKLKVSLGIPGSVPSCPEDQQVIDTAQLMN